MKKRIVSTLLATALMTSVIGLTGCGGEKTGGGSSSATTATTGSITTALTQAPTEAASDPTKAPSGNPAEDTYGLSKLAENTPSVGDPITKDKKSELALTEDGNWAVDNRITMKDGKVLINATGDGATAFNVEQALGSVWKAEANFRPIKAYPAEQPTCARLFINNSKEKESEVLILTVNFIDKMAELNTNNVEVMLQMYNGKRWKDLYTSNGWFETTSKAFHFELERAEGSKKIKFKVVGDQGELVSKETIAEIPADLVDTPVSAGFGVYTSAVEYSDIKVTGNGPKEFTFGTLQVK